MTQNILLSFGPAANDLFQIIRMCSRSCEMSDLANDDQKGIWSRLYD